jgi:phenylacetate-coenzyme A ligase PaaK-like adenylate-forming protein
MFDINDLFQIRPYNLNIIDKEKIYTDALNDLTRIHYNNCSLYRNLLNGLKYNIEQEHSLKEIPLLPVRLFKDYDLYSIDTEQIIKTMTSSGTSGQKVSRIFLDKKTSTNQTKVLTKIMADFLGPKRIPMIIIDSKAVVKDRKLFSARGAGIMGFSMLGYDITYALDDNMELDLPLIQEFLAKHAGEDIFIFGFTYMIWEYFYKKLLELTIKIDLTKGILLHGGGFKKLAEQAVDNETFKSKLKEICNIQKVYNYYGMVEQTGSIFMECEHGRLHASIYSDVFIRDFKTFQLCQVGKKGLIQLVSVLPESYPGHSILTEDEGEIIGEDDCPCGRLGKTFKIHGRIKQAEIRGCSDTYEKR